MTYRRRTQRNWGVLIASAVGVALAFAWFVIVLVGGSLVCEGIDAPCENPVIEVLTGVAAITVGAVALGWIVNRIVDPLQERGRERQDTQP
jgi:hypothetical protein